MAALLPLGEEALEDFMDEVATLGHRLLPSELNFRANIFGMKRLGVEYILSASAVGSLREEYKPLDIVIPDQFYDRTRHRVSTFFGRGLVARERDESNRKQYLLTLTTEGQRILKELFDPVADIETKLLDGFDGGQTEILRTYLLRCRHSLSGHPPR